MPEKGWHFDAIPRQSEFDEELLRAEDNLEEVSLISDEILNHLRHVERPSSQAAGETPAILLSKILDTGSGFAVSTASSDRRRPGSAGRPCVRLMTAAPLGPERTIVGSCFFLIQLHPAGKGEVCGILSAGWECSC